MYMKLPVKKLTIALYNAILLSSLAACGGGGGGDDPKPKPEPVEKSELTVTETNDSDYLLSISEYGDMFTGSPYVISYTKKPTLESLMKDAPDISLTAKYGVVSDMHPQTGEPAAPGTMFYYVPMSVLDSLDNIYSLTDELTVTDSGNRVSLYKLELGAETAHGDPVFTDQWHIKNVGQNPFSVYKTPVAGIDLNVIPAWHLTDTSDELISGKNIKVAVFDAPVDLKHEEFSGKIHTPSISASYINKGVSLNDVKKNSSILHGTQVAGIIGAAAGNGKGVRGIAPDVKLTSYELSNTNLSVLTRKNDLDLVNASMGIDDSYSFNPNIDLINDTMFENGIPFIKAAGNEFYMVTFDYGKYYPVTMCKNLGVSCQYNQTSSINRGRYFIKTGAVNSQGKRSSYSSVGSFLWVSGFGGEFGYDGSYTSSAAVVTSYFSQDPSKFDDKDAGTPWRTNAKYKNARKFYTHRMNGTSSATPTVTGVSSLIMQAKPDITVPQLRYILATTANNDSSWNSLSYSPLTRTVSDLNNISLTLDNGWHTNGAGLRFSNQYGFGVVNAEKAVKAALDCNSDELCAKRAELPEDYKSTNANPCTSSDGGLKVTCKFRNFTNVNNQNDSSADIDIENVSINLASFGYYSATPETEGAETVDTYCNYAAATESIYPEAVGYANNLLHIEMTSPDGTKSVVKPVYANWDFQGKALNKISGYNYLYPFLIHSSDFFTEKVSAQDTFTVTFRSKCKIDVSELNKKIYVLIGGYPDRQ